MPLFTSVLLNNVLPAFLVMGIGFLVDRMLHIDKRTMSRLAIYVLTPSLVFSAILRSTVDPRDFGLMLLFVFVITFAMVGIGLLVGRLLRWPQGTTDALVLSIAFLNSGNFGMSVVLFTFGDAGLELASIFYVGCNLVVNTVAAFFAARGNTGGAKKALLKVFKLPGVYAFTLAALFRALSIQVPAPLLKPINLIGNAAVPMLLMMLGIQLSQTHLGRRFKEVGVAVALRLGAGTVMAILLAPLMGLQGLARDVAIVEASTPTAVNSALMAIEFDADAELVTSVVFFSTLLSSVTLTVLIAFLT